MGPADHFERLGLPRRFSLDPAEVERLYLERSRELHPDVFQLGSTSEQRASLELSSALNEAYATLRDPFRRAEYLLELEGGPGASEVKEMPPAFLEEMLAARMQIEELRETSPPGAPEREAMEAELAARRDALLREVGDAFGQLPQAGPRRGEVLREIREKLNATKFVQGLLRDLRAD
ncbi:MAG TPA: Fe-S protein assembly co-chaperone HscB [Gemmataceae bacterium]